MHDTIAFMESAARTGLAGIARAGGEVIYQGAGDEIAVRGAGRVRNACVITATIANLVNARFRHSEDAKYNYVRMFLGDQTAVRKLHKLAYEFPSGVTLTADADNGGNAQYDALLLFLGDEISETAPAEIPAGAKLVTGVGAGTNTAGAWTPVTLTFSETFQKGRKYKIIGMSAWQATGYGARLAHSAGEAMKFRPGVPSADTASLAQMYYGDFGTFDGESPPVAETLSSGADTAQLVQLLIVPQ